MWKNLSFRAKLALIVLPQLAVLLAFSVLVVQPRAQEAREAEHAREHAIVARSAMNVIDALQAERGLASWVMVGGGRDVRELMANARAETDAARNAFSALMSGDSRHLAGSPAGATGLAAMETLPTLRSEVDAATSAPDALFDRYTEVVDRLIEFNAELLGEASDARLIQRGTAITEFLAAKEQHGLLLGTVVRRLQTGSLTVDDLAYIDAQLAAEDAHVDAFTRASDAETVRRLEAIEDAPVVRTSDELIERVRRAARDNDAPDVTAAEWWNNVSVEFNALDTLDDKNFDDYVTTASDIATSQRNQALLYTVVTVAAVLGSMAGALLLGRSLNRRLASIAAQARTISHDRLPEVLEALRHPTPEALAEALPQVQTDATDEIGTMADAFNVVLRTSVETSLNHAEERARTVTNMLLNLGRRNQSLIDRQLSIMDELESTHDDPDLLERLFRIDHLVTRMRRNAENLVVLAGEHQPRSWTEAVPLLDVLRAATGEVPDLERIDIAVGQGDDIEVAGPHAVTLSHLLAELVENAMSFSPPSTKVALSTDRVRGELRVWVVDNGLGMEDWEVQEANERLASPPDIDVLTTDRIGFQVVGRLARQLGVEVQLQANPGGGVAAAVTLPSALFELPRRDAPALAGAVAFSSSAHSGGGGGDHDFRYGTAVHIDDDDVIDLEGIERIGTNDHDGRGDAFHEAATHQDPLPDDRDGDDVELPFAGGRGVEAVDDESGRNGFRRVPLRRVAPPEGLPVRTPMLFQFEPGIADDVPVIDLRDAPEPPATFGRYRGEDGPNQEPARDALDALDAPDALDGRRSTTDRLADRDADRIPNGTVVEPSGTAGEQGSEPATWVTADGLVKRRPGGTMAGNSRAAEADAGAFRRLPDPTEADGEETRGRRRFADLSRLQSAVAAAREQDSDPEGEA
ncbi:MAG: sensor histidine kinase [Acidimicrobiales bacterium]|nr:sensor histidine kinase [Acidimicrobiales bacterium]